MRVVGSVTGTDRINDLKYKYNQLQETNKKLAQDIKSTQRVLSDQTGQLQKIEQEKGYTSQIESLLIDLDGIYAANKQVNQKIVASHSKISKQKSQQNEVSKKKHLAELSLEELQKLVYATQDDIQQLKAANRRKEVVIKRQSEYSNI